MIYILIYFKFVAGHGAVVQPASINIAFGYKQALRYSRKHQLGFIRVVSWSAQNAESRWLHVHITLTAEPFNFRAFYKKCGLQARNQLGTPGGAKSFPKGPHFLTCPIFLNHVQQMFPGEAKNFLGTASPPFAPSGYAPGGLQRDLMCCSSRFTLQRR